MKGTSRVIGSLLLPHSRLREPAMPYAHLSEHDRYLIDHLHLAGFGPREIGRRLRRSAGTISRELTRNRDLHAGPYWSYRAQALARERQHRPRARRKMAHGPLADFVRIGLCSHWSPQQIAGRLCLDHPRDPAMRISHEAIYQWIYAQNNHWHESLRQHHVRRKPRRPAGAAKTGQIIDRLDIAQRPAVVERRTRLGDWESDTLAGTHGG